MRLRTAGDDRGFSRLLPGVMVATRITATFERDRDDDPPYEGELTADFIDGRYQVVELTCRRIKEGPPITSEGLRQLPIGWLLGTAAWNWTFQETEGLRRLPLRQMRTPYEEAGPADTADGPTDNALRKIAVVYQLSFACGLPPTRAVEETFELPRSTAGRWIGRARERRFLPPASPSASGARSRRGVD